MDFLNRSLKVSSFKIQTVQTDNGTTVTYQIYKQTEKSSLEKALAAKGIARKLISPRAPWRSGKVGRSHRNDQRYFYDWKKFAGVHELNQRQETPLSWSNNKAIRTLGWKSPLGRLAFFLGLHH